MDDWARVALGIVVGVTLLALGSRIRRRSQRDARARDERSREGPE